MNWKMDTVIMIKREPGKISTDPKSYHPHQYWMYQNVLFNLLYINTLEVDYFYLVILKNTLKSSLDPLCKTIGVEKNDCVLQFYNYSQV